MTWPASAGQATGLVPRLFLIISGRLIGQEVRGSSPRATTSTRAFDCGPGRENTATHGFDLRQQLVHYTRLHTAATPDQSGPIPTLDIGRCPLNWHRPLVARLPAISGSSGQIVCSLRPSAPDGSPYRPPQGDRHSA